MLDQIVHTTHEKTHQDFFSHTLSSFEMYRSLPTRIGGFTDQNWLAFTACVKIYPIKLTSKYYLVELDL